MTISRRDFLRRPSRSLPPVSALRWVCSRRPDSAGQGQVSTARAVAAGLTHRPLSDPVADALAWYRTWPAERRNAKLEAGIAPEREAEVLAAWKATTPGAA